MNVLLARMVLIHNVYTFITFRLLLLKFIKVLVGLKVDI